MYGGGAMSEANAVIYGWRKPQLDLDSAAFFRAANPWGFILFGGACQSRDQVRRLVGELQNAVQREALIFIDQEGGRVARLKPPEWPEFPPAAAYGALYKHDPELGLEACTLGHQLIAHELFALGIRADCAPVLDLPAAGADPVIGNRAFSADPAVIAALAKAALAGLANGGVAGVIKHMPGHGRADVDTHFAMPRVAAVAEALQADLAPFKALKDAPMGMTAHLLYEAWDDQNPATTSRAVIQDIIRGEIGFNGLLMTDDLNMKALGGGWWEKADAALGAGCDVLLHCSGLIEEMEQLATAVPRLAGRSLARARAAEAAALRPPQALDHAAAWQDLELFLSELEQV
jgi:beta-N-acetylhexosaminidase